MSDLKNLTAADVMSKELLTVCESWSIQSLIDFFSEKNISGAPVLSKSGDIIGVVSLSDVLKFDVNPNHSLDENPMSQYYFNALEGVTPDELGLSKGNQHQNHLVSEIMTPRVISVAADETVPNIAKLMNERKIHRVFISRGSEICGVVSTLDILTQVSQAA